MMTKLRKTKKAIPDISNELLLLRDICQKLQYCEIRDLTIIKGVPDLVQAPPVIYKTTSLTTELGIHPKPKKPRSQRMNLMWWRLFEYLENLESGHIALIEINQGSPTRVLQKSNLPIFQIPTLVRAPW